MAILNLQYVKTVLYYYSSPKSSVCQITLVDPPGMENMRFDFSPSKRLESMGTHDKVDAELVRTFLSFVFPEVRKGAENNPRLNSKFHQKVLSARIPLPSGTF